MRQTLRPHSLLIIFGSMVLAVIGALLVRDPGWIWLPLCAVLLVLWTHWPFLHGYTTPLTRSATKIRKYCAESPIWGRLNTAFEFAMRLGGVWLAVTFVLFMLAYALHASYDLNDPFINGVILFGGACWLWERDRSRKR